MTKAINKRIITAIICALLAVIAAAFSVNIPANAAGNIGKAKAKSIALKDAKVKKKSATFIKCKLKKDNGVKQYDIEFLTKRYKYEYEIKAKNGKILDKEKEKIKNYKGNDIGKAKAKSIAVKDAGFKKSAVIFKKCKLDVDNGIRLYEVEFTKGSKKYEYDINSKSGKIIDKDIDYI